MRAWLVIVAAILGGGAVIGLSGEAQTTNDPSASLPAAAESTRVAEIQRSLPSGDTEPAIVVYARDGQPLTEADLAAAAQIGTPIPAPDGRAAIVPVDVTGTTVEALRAKVQAGLPPGLTGEVTGPAGFAADIADSFSGANTTLLIVTVIVVTVLLLITYRSPILWLVPLAVVGLADQVAAGVVAILSRHTDLVIGGSTVGIVTVLVFGAGTNYALLLISRYREELRRHEDRREAMRRALRGAGPAVAASALTVVVSLLTLLFASLGDTVALGVTAAAGIGIAALFALVVLPAALVVCGRGLFWPFIPRAGTGDDDHQTGFWARIGRGVAKRPGPVTVAALIVLGILAAGLPGTRLGLSQTEQFRVEAESVAGFETLSEYFPAGAADPLSVLVPPAEAAATVAAAEGSPAVAAARIAEETADWVRIETTLTTAPDTDESFDAIRTLRDTLPEAALVGGSAAIDLDVRDASRRDLGVIVPLILALVLLILGALLRSAVAAVLLIITVIASFAAALGAGAWLFREVLGYPALDNQVPLYSFLFLVALGVDYNIFLTTRAREETAARGTREGMIVALSATGAVITSAGILLAAVFAVLGVLPVVTLTQIGVIVGLGVLLDTLLVRTVLVPALATMLGDRFWWPVKVRRPEPALQTVNAGGA